MKPQCLRCVSTGRKCDGYVTLGTFCLDVFGDEREARSYQFFHERTKTELGGFYDSFFWNGLILQASHSEEALRHVLVAIGALHEALQLATFGDDGQASTNLVRAQRLFSMHHYNRSIQLLTQAQAVTPVRTELVLMTCILFICLENMQSNYLGALKHLHGGLNILEKWREPLKTQPWSFTAGSSSAVILDQLVPMFQRLNVHDHISREPLLKDVNPRLPAKDVVGYALNVPRVPVSFHRLHEARACLDHLIPWSAHALEAEILQGDRCETLGTSVISSVNQLLHDWAKRFDTYLSTNLNQSNNSYHRAVTFLRIRHRLASLLLLTVPRTNETELDEFSSDFGEILEMCREFVEAGGPSVISNVTFGFDLCIIPPLYLIVAECRDPRIRREAIKILRSCRRREGVWNSWVTANIAELVMRAEEYGLPPIRSASDIPSRNRVNLVDVDFYAPANIDPRQ